MDAAQLQTEFGDRVTRVSVCSVCQEQYTTDGTGHTPMQLPCSHTLCQTCLDQLRRRQPNPPCPFCRTPLAGNVPNHGVLVDMNQILVDWREMSCLQHPGKFADVYCENCRTAMCVTCSTQVHSGHRTMLTSLAAERLKAELQADIVQLSGARGKVEDGRAAQRDHDAAIQTLLRTIRQEEQVKISRIKENANQLATDLTQLQQQKHRDLDLEGRHAAISRTIQRIESVFPRPYELVRQAFQLRAEASNVLQSVPAINPNDVRRIGAELRVARLEGNLVGDLVSTALAQHTPPRLSYNELNLRLAAATDAERQAVDSVRRANDEKQVVQTRLDRIDTELRLARQTQESVMAENNRQQTTIDRLSDALQSTEATLLQIRTASAAVGRRADEMEQKLRHEQTARGRLQTELDTQTALRQHTDNQNRHLRQLVDDLTNQLQEERQQSRERADASCDQLIQVMRESRDSADNRVADLTNMADQRQRQLEQEMELRTSELQSEIENLNRQLEEANTREQELRRTVNTRIEFSSRDDLSHNKSPATRTHWCPRSRTWLLATVVMAVVLALLWQWLLVVVSERVCGKQQWDGEQDAGGLLMGTAAGFNDTADDDPIAIDNDTVISSTNAVFQFTEPCGE